MYEIKKIKVWPTAKIGGIIGCVPVIVFAILSFFSRGLFSSYIYSSPFYQLQEFFVLLIVPIIGGFAGGALVAFIYNLIAPRIGGIELEIVLKEEKKEKSADSQ